jgi:hypothetical protein
VRVVGGGGGSFTERTNYFASSVVRAINFAWTQAKILSGEEIVEIEAERQIEREKVREFGMESA